MTTSVSGAVAIIATLDTKAQEATYLSDVIERCGRRAVLIDVGTTKTGVSAAGTANSGRVAAPAELLQEIAAVTRPRIANLHASGAISAIVGVAGGKGSGLFGEVVADLPYGFPKLLISSARPALLAELAGKSDIIIYPTLVDLFGVNEFTARILQNAGRAIAAMHYTPPSVRRSTKIVAITAFGVTTPAASRCVTLLAEAGVEAIVFPANGAGGRKMESLLAAGEFDAVLDLTTTELADEVVGGTASAGPDRLKAAGSYPVPQLVAPGAVDMVNFGPPSSVPEQFRDRQFYSHTRYTTLMRTTALENEEIGRLTAKRLSHAQGPCLVLWPARGVSDYDREGGIFRDAAADAAWLSAVKRDLPATIECRDLDCHINDPEFADTAVAWIVQQLQGTA
ncbi:Tm-1-like ATP-binding domain-containing protein [Bradyrhizobium sp. Arg314]